MKVLITTLGRSHFIQVASSLISIGVDAYLFQGWIVKDAAHSWFVRLAARLLGRGESFIYGFTRRTTTELQGRNIGDFWGEFLQTVAERTVGRISRWWWNWSIKLGFRVHGWRMARLLKRGNYQIAHVKSGLGRGGCISMAKKKGVKVLADHSAGAPQFVVEDVGGKQWGKWSYWWSVMEDCNDADLLMVNSDFVKSTFLRYGYPEGKMRVVYMGMDQRFNGLKKWGEDLTLIGKSSGRPLRIVFSGPFAEHKGNVDFLGAIELLLDAELYFTVDVLGSVNIDADSRGKFSRAIAKIHFHGHLPQDKMCDVMKQAHIYLFPSHSEGCAKSAFEALSMGLCIVCTYETGLPAVDGESCFLIERRNPQSIKDKILWLAEHPDRIESAGKAGTELMKKYTWEFYAENVKKVYEELLAK